MTMIKGKGPGGATTIDNIDLPHAKDIVCEKCGHVNEEFVNLSKQQ